MRNALISTLLFVLSTLYFLLVKVSFKDWAFVQWHEPGTLIFALLLCAPAITLWGAATLYLYRALRDLCTWAGDKLHALLDKALDVFSEVDHPFM